LWAQPRIVSQYENLYKQLGCDVVVFNTPYGGLWISPWATYCAHSILRALEAQLSNTGTRPVFFCLFSGASICAYYKILQVLEPDTCATAAEQKQDSQGLYPLVRKCLAGQLFDSSPVNFASQTGVKLLSSGSQRSDSGSHPEPAPRSILTTTGSAVRNSAVQLAAGTMDFFLFEHFDRRRRDMWKTLEEKASCPAHTPSTTSPATSATSSSPPPAIPTLFLYSWDDHTADAHMIHSLASKLRCRGGQVLEQSWSHSPHVSHLRHHRADYQAAVAFFLQQATQQWQSRQQQQQQAPAAAAAAAAPSAPSPSQRPPPAALAASPPAPAGASQPTQEHSPATSTAAQQPEASSSTVTQVPEASTSLTSSGLLEQQHSPASDDRPPRVGASPHQEHCHQQQQQQQQLGPGTSAAAHVRPHVGSLSPGAGAGPSSAPSAPSAPPASTPLPTEAWSEAWSRGSSRQRQPGAWLEPALQPGLTHGHMGHMGQAGVMAGRGSPPLRSKL